MHTFIYLVHSFVIFYSIASIHFKRVFKINPLFMFRRATFNINTKFRTLYVRYQQMILCTIETLILSLKRMKKLSLQLPSRSTLYFIICHIKTAIVKPMALYHYFAMNI